MRSPPSTFFIFSKFWFTRKSVTVFFCSFFGRPKGDVLIGDVNRVLVKTPLADWSPKKERFDLDADWPVESEVGNASDADPKNGDTKEETKKKD